MCQLLRVLGDLEGVAIETAVWGRGEVNEEHPVVRRLGLSLPKCRPVIVMNTFSIIIAHEVVCSWWYLLVAQMGYSLNSQQGFP